MTATREEGLRLKIDGARAILSRLRLAMPEAGIKYELVSPRNCRMSRLGSTRTEAGAYLARRIRSASFAASGFIVAATSLPFSVAPALPCKPSGESDVRGLRPPSSR